MASCRVFCPVLWYLCLRLRNLTSFMKNLLSGVGDCFRKLLGNLKLTRLTRVMQKKFFQKSTVWISPKLQCLVAYQPDLAIKISYFLSWWLLNVQFLLMKLLNVSCLPLQQRRSHSPHLEIRCLQVALHAITSFYDSYPTSFNLTSHCLCFSSPAVKARVKVWNIILKLFMRSQKSSNCLIWTKNP